MLGFCRFKDFLGFLSKFTCNLFAWKIGNVRICFKMFLEFVARLSGTDYPFFGWISLISGYFLHQKIMYNKKLYRVLRWCESTTRLHVTFEIILFSTWLVSKNSSTTYSKDINRTYRSLLISTFIKGKDYKLLFTHLLSPKCIRERLF